MSVYFCMGPADHVKIGHTTRSVDERVAELQTSSPVHLEVVGDYQDLDRSDEALLHALLEPYKLEGEWFRRVAPIRELIEQERELAAMHPSSFWLYVLDEWDWLTDGQRTRVFAHHMECRNRPSCCDLTVHEAGNQHARHKAAYAPLDSMIQQLDALSGELRALVKDVGLAGR